MYYVYIIYSAKLDRYYIGYTEDVDVRLVQHNSGLSSFTSRASDWRVMYQEVFTSREDAHRCELYIKYKKSRKYIE